MQTKYEGSSNASVWIQSLGAALVLTACGGGGTAETTAEAPAGVASFEIAAASLPAEAASQIAEPTFHLAPVLLDEPGDADAVDNSASSRTLPHTQAIPADTEALQTLGLTVQALQQAQRTRALAAPRALADGSVAPMATSGAATTYTPAQIRAAYGLPTLPSAGLVPTAAQAAQLGAGQTIYIVDAMHDPNVAAELNAFNQKFGLPTCATKAIAPNAALPLAAAALGDGCVLSVVYSTVNGTMTTVAPAYNAGWATEIALDVQWAHATAPLARIVLIESADASLNGLLGAVKLANTMGGGAVSMSFGAAEGNWTASVDPAFAASGMTYLAATGDSGSAVSWPSVSTKVVAVGGTSLRYTTGARSETSWSRTGGGISAFTAKPAYQSNQVPGVGTLVRRAVADVAFNADPSTGQFVAVMTPGSSAVSWVSAGGTSLSTPQWAGLVAVANAMRVRAAKPLLGAPHGTLYGQIAAVPGSYAAAFSDVLSGANGTCATCAAKVGYDVPTGLGTPNVSALLPALGGAAAAPTAPVAPVVAAAAVNGKTGLPLSYSVTVTATTATGFSLANAPAGMAISNTGVISWANPVAGTYAVTVTALNAASGLSGKGLLTVVIAKSAAPVVNAPALVGVAGRPLGGSITVTAPTGGALMVTIGGIPVGVSFSVSGQSLVLYWARPVTGKYTLSISARDSSGATTQVSMPITINPN